MAHHFVFPNVQEITGDRTRPPAPAHSPRSQRDLVLASLLRRP
jgi:hypothetical protein